MKKNRGIRWGLTLSILIIASSVLSAPAYTQRPAARQTATSFRSILAKVPQNARTEFLESFVFIDGNFSTAYVAGIKPHLGQAEYKQLLSHLTHGLPPIRENFYCRIEGYDPHIKAECVYQAGHVCWYCTKGSFPGDSFGVLLARVPQRERGEFLESLDFENGRLVSAYVAGIKANLKQDEFEQLFRRFGITSGELQRKINGNYYSFKPGLASCVRRRGRNSADSED